MPLYNGPGEILLRIFLGIGIGWSGVDLFFVLSGFLITGILIDTRSSPRYFRAFYMRRVLRIFPLYFAFLAGVFGVLFPVARHYGWMPAYGRWESLWYWSYLSNWRTALGPEIGGASHTWSLAIEEQFYLAWPLVVLLVRPKRLPWICAGVCAGVLAIRLAAAPWLDPLVLYRATPFRLDSLCFGAMLAAIVRDPGKAAAFRKAAPRLAAAGILIVTTASAAAGTTAWDNAYMASFGFTGFALIYGCAVFRAFDAAGSQSRYAVFLRRPFLRACGKYSYAIYLLHRPVSVVLNALLRRAPVHLGPLDHLWRSAASLALCTSVSFGLAMLTWRWIETPFLRLKDRFPYSRGAA